MYNLLNSNSSSMTTTSNSHQQIQIPFQIQTNSYAQLINPQNQPQQPQQHQQQQQFYSFNQYSFQTQTISKPKWSVLNQENNNPNTTITPTPTTVTATTTTNSIVNTLKLKENLDEEHFNRHIENLNKNELDDNFSSVVEEPEELNELKLAKLISKTCKNKTDIIKEDQSRQEIEEDDDQDLANNDDEPKVFQDEEEVEVDLIPSNPVFLTKTNVSTKTDSNKLIELPVQKISSYQSVKQTTQTLNLTEKRIEMNLTSVMPTPLAYSRSSSLTSLNSFDVKSIHSSVASEYSHMPSKSKNHRSGAVDFENSQLDILNDDDEEQEREIEDDEEDIDRLMPESPAAPDSSFLKAQRIKHKQQQVEYRQNAVAAMLPLNNNQVKPTATIVTNCFTSSTSTQPFNLSNLNIKSIEQQMRNINDDTSLQVKPWQLSTTTTNTNELNSIMSRLTINNKPNKTVLNELKCDLAEQSSNLSYSSNQYVNSQSALSNQLTQSNTPPVKLLPTTPKFITQNSTTLPAVNMPPVLTVPAVQIPVPPPVMSVTYAFMKNSQNYIPQQTTTTTTTTATTNNLNLNQMQSNQPPKFLLSSNVPNHHHQVTFNHQIQTSYQPTTVLNKSPQQLINSGQDDEAPRIYTSHRAIVNPRQSGPTSPQESICSRMSDASIPSLIKQDITRSNQKFNSIMNQGLMLNQSKNSPLSNPNFKALFNKLQTTKQQQNHNHHDLNDLPISSSSSSSSSSCSSIINNPNHVQTVNQNNETYNNEDQNESFNNLNITTKPMNTPAGFASMSGASLIDVSTEEDEQQDTHQDDHKQQVSSSTTSTSNKESSLYIDFDLENFIKENFQPAKTINTSYDESDLLQTNKHNSKSFKRASLQSLDFSNLNPSTNQVVNKLSKPVQTTAKPTNKSTMSSFISNSKSSKKRLSEDNSSNSKPILTKQKAQTVEINSTSNRSNRNNSNSVYSITTNVTSSIPTSSSSMSISKIAQTKTSNSTNNPVVNMTKTAQLRASKLSTTTTATSTTNSNIQKKAIPTNQPVKTHPAPKQLNSQTNKLPINKIAKPISSVDNNDKLNQTINTDNVFHNEYQQLNQAQPVPPQSAHQHLQHLSSANSRRKSFSFGSSSSSLSSSTNATKKEPVKKENTTKTATTTTTTNKSVQINNQKSTTFTKPTASSTIGKINPNSNTKLNSKLSTKVT